MTMATKLLLFFFENNTIEFKLICFENNIEFVFKNRWFILFYNPKNIL